jgi:hypothetical protein
MAKPKNTGGRKRGGSGKRKSKAESMTGAKENAVEVRKLGGDNAPELKLPPVADFELHLKTARGIREKEQTIAKLKKHARDAANGCCKDLWNTISQLIKLEESDDPHAFQRKLELLGYGLKLTNSPIQLSIHDMLLGDVEDQAYGRGRKDGEAGKTLSNPYPDGTSLAAKYAEGHMHGQAKNLGLTTEQADAAVAEGASGNGSSSDPWPDDQQASGGEEIPSFLKRDKQPAPATH